MLNRKWKCNNIKHKFFFVFNVAICLRISYEYSSFEIVEYQVRELEPAYQGKRKNQKRIMLEILHNVSIDAIVVMETDNSVDSPLSTLIWLTAFL